MTDYAPLGFDVTLNQLLYNNGSGWLPVPLPSGVPTGGAAGQVLAKNSATNYDTVWGTPASGSANYCDITAYGAVGDGSTDCTAAINNAITAALAASHRNVWIPAGTFKCLSALSTLHSAINFRGVDKSYSVLERAFNGDFLTFDGSAGFNGDMEDIALVASSGTSTGTAITIKPGNASTSPDYSTFKNVLITGWGGTFYYGIIGNGLSRVAPNPNGLRDIDMRDITIFECTAAAAEFDAMTSALIDNLQTYGGSAGTGQVYIGASSGNDHVNTFLMPNATITGTLSVQNVDACFYATGAFNNVTLASTVAKAVMSGTKSGTLSNSAAASSINLI